MDPALPVNAAAPEILAALRRSNRLVLSAPTGSGKTTQVPQILHHADLFTGQIIVLQPRRLATRLVARRVAQEMNAPLGTLVGFQTRHESQIGPDTRIRFMTEGLLLRMLQSLPQLPGVGAVVLDEFHERSVAADLLLGLVKTLQETHRPDLKLIVMSATLDVQRVAEYLACPAVETGGRLHPVEVRSMPRRVAAPPWELAAEAMRTVAADPAATGDVLVFMPGVYEIHRTLDAIRRVLPPDGFSLRPLHGSLPPPQQDAAIAPAPRGTRRVIVATNVAETSITIEGVRWVIDAGLARVHRFDPQRAIDVLRVEPISRASADQRAGRAGRTGPGVCLRLWTEADQRMRDAHTDPEVRRVDLADAVVQLASLGFSAARFPWLKSPEPAALDRAESLLRELGALDASGQITATGRRMARFPAHPRLARMMLEAAERGGFDRAATWAALISEPELVHSSANARQLAAYQPDGEPASDLAVREVLLDLARRSDFDPRRCTELHVNATAARQAWRSAEQFRAITRRMGLAQKTGGMIEDLLRALLAGFADHLAVKLEPQRPHAAMPGRKRVTISPTSVVQQPGPILALDVAEVGRGEMSQTTLNLLTALPPELLADRITMRKVVTWNTESLAAEEAEESVVGELVIARTVRPATGPAAAAAIIERLMSGELRLEHWNEKVEQWIARVRCVAAWFPQKSLITYSDDERAVLLSEVVGDSGRWSAVRDRPVLDAVRGALSWEEQRFVEQMAPEQVALPTGRAMRLEYQPGSPPRGRAKIQDLYDLPDTPRVAGGRQKVLLEILAPNQRPVQVTDDLPGFWERLYPQVRAELKRNSSGDIRGRCGGNFQHQERQGGAERVGKIGHGAFVIWRFCL